MNKIINYSHLALIHGFVLIKTCLVLVCDADIYEVIAIFPSNAVKFYANSVDCDQVRRSAAFYSGLFKYTFFVEFRYTREPKLTEGTVVMRPRVLYPGPRC